MLNKMLGLTCVLALSVATYAQNITGSISGRLVDQQGGVVVNATITLTETSKKTVSSQKTSASGDFSLAGLLPGTYTLTVESPGFKKLTRTGINLDANDKLGLGDMTLQVGAVTDVVEVSGTAAALQTESVERSATISTKQIENLQTNGRNPLDMAKLVPGVNFTNGASYAVGSSGTGANQFSVNGARPSQNQLSLNGIGNVDTGNNGGMNVSVSNDSIAEFKILTGSYQAEYGRSVGAQISVVTKSGSSQFHGTGYWYHRNDSLNANTFLNNARPSFGQAFLPRPLFRYNDPGYTIGGPIFIPKLLERTKNKAFFFFSQEYQRQLVPNTARNVLVPTAAQRNGDFSGTKNQNGADVFIRDPLSGQTCNATDKTGCFLGNIVPASRIYKPGQALLNILPLPNTSASNYNYSSQFPGASPRRETLLRVDYNITDNLRVFGHWVDNQQPTVAPYGSFVLGLTVPIAPIANPVPGRSFAAGATWVISPSTTNEVNWGFTHNSILIDQVGDTLTRTKSGITLPLLYPSANQKDYIPQVAFNGNNIAAPNGAAFGTGNAPFVNYNTTIDLSDNFTKIWSTHTIKAGVYMQRSRKDQTSFANANGSYNFGDSTANPYDTNYGFSNALVGVYNTFSQAAAYLNGQYRYWNIEQYVQDTWKIRRNVTLDYGMRAAWYQPQYDASLQTSTFLPSQFDPTKAPRLYQRIPDPAKLGQFLAFDSVTNATLAPFNIGLEVPNTGVPFQGICQSTKCPEGKYLFPDGGLQWGPRFGVAWDITGKQNLVFRAGSGIYYDRIQGNRVFDSLGNPPQAITPTLNQGFVASIDPKSILIGPPGLTAADPTGKIPTTYQYQASIQTRLPSMVTLDVAYVGSQGRHLQNNRNLNYNPFGQCFQAQNLDTAKFGATPNALLGNNCKDANFLKPYPGYGSINLYESAATSNYNALQVTAQRRASKGLFMGVSYTWSKAMASSLSGGTGDNSFVRPDDKNRLANYAPASFDRRHILSINYVYSTPKFVKGNRFTRIITDGWQLSGVTQAISGSPFTPGFSISGAGNQNITGSYTEGGRIGVVKGCDPYTHSSDPFSRLNAACFFAPSPGSLGLESGINFLYGPAVVNFDTSLQKEVTVKERVRFLFKVDAFNVFNHTNFSGYNATLNFQGYPQTNGVVTGQPVLAANALSRNANGSVNFTGFGTPTQVGPGANGYARILQTVIRVTF